MKDKKKPLECPYCDMTFSTKEEKMKHAKEKHADKM
jgi:uncharacterized C2H2 Zn-finger protein